MQFGSHKTTVYYTAHPYGDFNFDEARKIRDGVELRSAWTLAQEEK